MNVTDMASSQKPSALRGIFHVTPEELLDMALNYTGTITVMVTPEVADALLSLNTGNRPLNKTWVAKLEDAIKRGAWKLTGEPIIISREGVMNDGQHRLVAAKQSGASIPMDIRFGVERAAMVVTGTGKARTPGHMMAMAGRPNGLRLAASIGVLVRYARYQRGEVTSYFHSLVVGHDQIKRLGDLAGDKLDDSVRTINNRTGFRPLSNALGTAAHYMTMLHDATKAEEFWKTIQSGFATEPSSAALRLRERLSKDAMSKARIQEEEKLALTLKAWLFYQRGKGVGELRFRSGGDKAEDFPKVPVLLPNVDVV